MPTLDFMEEFVDESTCAHNALISVRNRKNLPSFVKALQDLGWGVFTTQATFDFLRRQKVLTLNVLAYANLIHKRYHNTRRDTLAKMIGVAVRSGNKERGAGFPSFDLLYIDVELCIKSLKGNIIRALKIEGLDVGGNTLLNAAKSGNRYFICQPEKIQSVLDQLSKAETSEFDVLRLKSSLIRTARSVFAQKAKNNEKLPLFGV